MARFLTNEDLARPEVQRAIEALTALVKKETDKLTHEEYDSYELVERVYALVCWEHLRDLFMVRHNLDKESPKGGGLERLVGKTSLEAEGEFRIDGLDHVNLFLRDGKAAAFTSQPYGLDWERLRSTVEFCKAHELEVSIDGAMSWHFPGDTILLHFTKAPTKH